MLLLLEDVVRAEKPSGAGTQLARAGGAERAWEWRKYTVLVPRTQRPSDSGSGLDGQALLSEFGLTGPLDPCSINCLGSVCPTGSSKKRSMHYALCIVGSVHRPGDALRARLRGGSAAATASMSDVTIGLQVGEHGDGEAFDRCCCSCSITAHGREITSTWRQEATRCYLISME